MEHVCVLSGSLYGIVVDILECNMVVSEFELQPRYYVYFQTNTLGKGMNLLIQSVLG